MTTTLKDAIRRFLVPGPPPHIVKRFIRLDTNGEKAVRSAIERHYFTPSYLADRNAAGLEAYLARAEGVEDIADHERGRLNLFRDTVIPWFDQTRKLDGAAVLEIGCGTGSSTVALAEQGARVTAVDICANSLAAARERCRIYGMNADFHQANATDVARVFSGKKFDFIIFFATLEHMTHEERLSAMASTWEMLAPGSYWCVVDTPNRLWYFDGHTAFLPFYFWLPDDLAVKYARFSPRKNFSSSYIGTSNPDMLHFLRRGRGVSFHEFDLAIGPSVKLDVVSSLGVYLRSQSLVRRLSWMRKPEAQYEAFLKRTGPPVHPGFYQPNLNLILRKT